MENIYDNYRMVEEVKERAVERGNGSTEFESYDRVAKIERRSGVEEYAAGFSDYHG
jgi:hypothetical protein